MSTMNKKTILGLAAIAALAWYWIWPLGTLILQFRTSDRKLEAQVGSIPGPRIERVFVLPSYDFQNQWSGGEHRRTVRRIPSTNTILIVGRHFKSLDENNPQIVAIAKLGGEVFSRERSHDPSLEDCLIELVVDHSILPAKPDERLEVTVTREGMVSPPSILTGIDVSHQIAAARGTVPAIIDAIPVGFPLTTADVSSLTALFVIAGWPDDEVILSRRSAACSLEVDGRSFDCHEYIPFRNLNVIKWQLSGGVAGHEISFALDGAVAPSFHFETREFESYSKKRRALRRAYYESLSRRELAAGRQIPLVGQDKNASLPALGINVGLTLMVLIALRPWRQQRAFGWVLVFVLPVALQALAGVLFGILMQSGTFLAPAIGFLLILSSLWEACFPAIQATFVALLITHVMRAGRSLAV
jgi:hypothetical protein